MGAALRRHREPEPFVLGELAINHGPRRVTLRGEAVELSATEYELLRLLSVNAGRVVHRETPMRRVRGDRGGGGANLIRIYARKLCGKLGDDAQDPTWIFNHRGVGYRMPKPEDVRQDPDTPEEARPGSTEPGKT
ncbi:MAG: winged helix-turn-helix domain-containing protein [Rhodospirillales bacterium]|nr:winged helix-turn-helix domain-containing protein [Rhodospirillales bacterium]